ncbi:O-phosphoseryl-tRNA(Sec) selenium transferase isoform X1 [Rhagoletis pomonella]|uniref:O-phosphoseryl-tRNA(Sec) selenium transferase isoform X1 n=1 Tax=Rhagoletis pomonella TaxID=28610 RepID=UPI001785CFD6|nr:O-phosphoseryl-tRNA(Sec) selenium transferase isoform X1 [Rhagoletis pomonella]
MDLKNLHISEKLVPQNYLRLAQDAQKAKETARRELLEKRKLPVHGWPDAHIEEMVQQLASLDSNNFPKKAGVGEREARIACPLVARRHYNFGHGIGRSGDLLEAQPKAAGSTLMANLTNSLLLDLIHEMGVRSCRACFLSPLATGMSLLLCLLTLRQKRPAAKYVLWSRIDQKSCFKSIITAGLTPLIIQPRLADNGALSTDLPSFARKVEEVGAENILCFCTTTSCFAPRNCDDIIEVAKLATQHAVPHLVNNAYGLQSTHLTHQLEQAQRLGRLDLFVQSTDKNLLVPVGGAIIAGFDEELVRSVAKAYPGRASSSQTLDVFMTLLSLGRVGYMNFVKERKTNFEYLRECMHKFAQEHAEHVVETKGNPISLALSLSQLQDVGGELTKFGSMLYTRGISGARVLTVGDTRKIEGHEFVNWGTHHSDTSTAYLTMAAGLGITKAEIHNCFEKLNECWQTVMNQKLKLKT